MIMSDQITSLDAISNVIFSMTIFGHKFDFEHEDSPDKAFLEKCCSIYKKDEKFVKAGNCGRMLRALWYANYKDKEML